MIRIDHVVHDARNPHYDPPVCDLCAYTFQDNEAILRLYFTGDYDERLLTVCATHRHGTLREHVLDWLMTRHHKALETIRNMSAVAQRRSDQYVELSVWTSTEDFLANTQEEHA
jgi:hypothetical protein